MQTELLDTSDSNIDVAIKLLKNGEVIALPTETVYGLAGNACDVNAVLKIFEAKGRPHFDPLIVHISEKYLKDPRGIIPALIDDQVLANSITRSLEYATIQKVMNAFWPGPLTLILPKGPNIPDLVTAGTDTVGIRMPAHPVFQKILSNLPFPLAAPSANRFGRISPTAANHAIAELSGRIAGVVDGGPCSVGVESTIVRVLDQDQIEILRPGKIGAQELSPYTSKPIVQNLTLGQKNEEALIAPGTLAQHYAPKKPLYLLTEELLYKNQLERFSKNNLDRMAIILLHAPSEAQEQAFNPEHLYSLSLQNDLNECARNLFSTLRKLDSNSNYDEIIAVFELKKGVSLSALGGAILDRLNRASVNKPI